MCRVFDLNYLLDRELLRARRFVAQRDRHLIVAWWPAAGFADMELAGGGAGCSDGRRFFTHVRGLIAFVKGPLGFKASSQYNLNNFFCLNRFFDDVWSANVS